MDDGLQLAVTPVIVGGELTTTVVLPDFVESCVDLAMMVSVPAAAGVKMPELLTLPELDGTSDQTTDVLKFPVPVTVGEQLAVWLVRIAGGEQVTMTEVMVEEALTVTVAVPDLDGSCVEVAVTIAVPEPLGVNTPEALIDPNELGLTAQVTAEL